MITIAQDFTTLSEIEASLHDTAERIARRILVTANEAELPVILHRTRTTVLARILDAPQLQSFEDTMECAREARAVLAKIVPQEVALGPGWDWLLTRLSGLAALMHLNDVAIRVVAFLYLAKFDGTLGAIGGASSHIHRRRDFSRRLSTVLQGSPQAIFESLDFRHALRLSGLVQRNAHGHTLSDFYEVAIELDQDMLSNIPLAESVLESLAPACTAASVALSPKDFGHVRADFEIVRELVAYSARQRNVPCHVLIHGAPGVGKTEFARAVARATELGLYEISSQNSGSTPKDKQDRFAAYAVASRLLADTHNAILLFDEAEDVFSGEHLTVGDKSEFRKAWTNRLLETSRTPTIWISNSSFRIDPAFLRRFDYVLHLKVPPRTVRHAMTTHALAPFDLPVHTLKAIGDSDRLTPADLSRTRRVLQALAGSKVDLCEAARKVVSCRPNGVESTKLRRDTGRLTIPYRAEWINADADIAGIARSLKGRPGATIGLSGPPGSGKTELARHLANQLDAPLLVKKASDILDKWLGGTEQKIAEAFKEAEEDDAVLLLDEADSFLRDRGRAERSWEITQVNEILAQLDGFAGVAILATNHFGSLDKALIRRLHLKVSMGFLKPGSVREVFTEALRALGAGGDAALSEEVLHELSHMNACTFGNIIAAARGLLWSEARTPERLLDALRRELALERRSHPIGFVA